MSNYTKSEPIKPMSPFTDLPDIASEDESNDTCSMHFTHSVDFTQTLDSMSMVSEFDLINSDEEAQIDPICPKTKPEFTFKQTRKPETRRKETNQIFIVQNSSDNLAVAKTRSKLKKDENPINNFIKLKKGANISDFEYLDRDEDSTQSGDRKKTKKFYPKKENYIMKVLRDFQKIFLKILRNKLIVGELNISDSKRQKLLKFYTFCMELKAYQEFVEAVSLKPSFDSIKKFSEHKSSKKHSSYSNDFLWTYFENYDVRQAFMLYIDYIFETESNFELKTFFNFNCCLKNTCSSKCNKNWKSLKEATLSTFIVRPSKLISS